MVSYQFKPNGHWNYISERAFNQLLKFYGPNMLRVVKEQ